MSKDWLHGIVQLGTGTEVIQMRSWLVLPVVSPPPHGLPPHLRPHRPTEQQETQEQIAPNGRFHAGSTAAEPAQVRADVGRAAGPAGRQRGPLAKPHMWDRLGTVA